MCFRFEKACLILHCCDRATAKRRELGLVEQSYSPAQGDSKFEVSLGLEVKPSQESHTGVCGRCSPGDPRLYSGIVFSFLVYGPASFIGDLRREV